MGVSGYLTFLLLPHAGIQLLGTLAFPGSFLCSRENGGSGKIFWESWCFWEFWIFWPGEWKDWAPTVPTAFSDWSLLQLAGPVGRFEFLGNPIFGTFFM